MGSSNPPSEASVAAEVAPACPDGAPPGEAPGDPDGPVLQAARRRAAAPPSSRARAVTMRGCARPWRSRVAPVPFHRRSSLLLATGAHLTEAALRRSGECAPGADLPMGRESGRKVVYMNFNSVLIGTDEPEKMVEYYTKLFGEPTWKDESYSGWQIGSGVISIGRHSEVSGRNTHPASTILNFETTDGK